MSDHSRRELALLRRLAKGVVLLFAVSSVPALSVAAGEQQIDCSNLAYDAKPGTAAHKRTMECLGAAVELAKRSTLQHLKETTSEGRYGSLR